MPSFDASKRTRCVHAGRAGRVLGAVALAATLAACGSVGPDYQVPPDAMVNAPAATAPFVSAKGQGDPAAPDRAALFSNQPLPDHWWRLYDDAALDALIERALAHNTDLRVAAANLERVRAMESAAQGARQPTIGTKAGAQYGHVSGLSLLQQGYVPENDVEIVL